jgi:hypothetical protein
MVYAIRPRHALDQTYKAMRGYKAPAPVAAHQELVGSLLALGLKGHADCDRRLSGLGSYQWAVVPSTRGTDREHPLHRLVMGLTRTPGNEVPVTAVTGAADYRRLEPANYAVDGAAVRDGGHVLLIDDSWVQGAHAQSVAATLRQSGAGSVSILTVARVMKRTSGRTPLHQGPAAARRLRPGTLPVDGRGLPLSPRKRRRRSRPQSERRRREPAWPSWPARHLPSEMLLPGFLAAVPELMKRPVTADRYPLALLGTVWVTVVRGDFAAVRGLTKRPVAALRETLRAI